MAKNTNISMAVIRRLPKYYRYLNDLLEKEIYKTSSRELSVIMGLTASQIRQDLNCFGGFGQQGYGYNVQELHNEIGKILGLSQVYSSVIVGSGNLGQAIANYTNFKKLGFELLALFDTSPELVGKNIGGAPVCNVNELEVFVDKNHIDIGIICTPKQYAQYIADKLCNGGVRGIWNFAPRDLIVPKGVVVENVHLSESLFILSYLLKNEG